MNAVKKCEILCDFPQRKTVIIRYFYDELNRDWQRKGTVIASAVLKLNSNWPDINISLLLQTPVRDHLCVLTALYASSGIWIPFM